MKGLLLKEFYTMRGSMRVLSFFLVFFVAAGFLFDDPSFFASFIGVFCIMLPISSFSYDQYCGWDLYGATLPAGRRAMVRAKYQIASLLALFSVTTSIVFQLAVLLLKKGNIVLYEILASSLAAGGVGLLFVLLLLPIIYRFGVEKGRLVMVVIGFTFMGLILLLSAPAVENPFASSGQLTAILGSIPFAIAVIFWLSYYLSCRFFEAKDL